MGPRSVSSIVARPSSNVIRFSDQRDMKTPIQSVERECRQWAEGEDLNCLGRTGLVGEFKSFRHQGVSELLARRPE